MNLFSIQSMPEIDKSQFAFLVNDPKKVAILLIGSLSPFFDDNNHLTIITLIQILLKPFSVRKGEFVILDSSVYFNLQHKG